MKGSKQNYSLIAIADLCTDGDIFTSADGTVRCYGRFDPKSRSYGFLTSSGREIRSPDFMVRCLTWPDKDGNNRHIPTTGTNLSTV